MAKADESDQLHLQDLRMVTGARLAQVEYNGRYGTTVRNTMVRPKAFPELPST